MSREIKVLKRIDIESLCKLVAVIYGIVASLIVLATILFSSFSQSPGLGFPLMKQIIFTAALQFLLAVGAVALSAAAYNYFAKRIGGIKFEMESSSGPNEISPSKPD
jgi:hypothetical protein